MFLTDPSLCDEEESFYLNKTVQLKKFFQKALKKLETNILPIDF